MSLREGRGLRRGHDPRTLTEWQWSALSNDYNLSDAHARDALYTEERSVLARAAQIFDEVSESDQPRLEKELVDAIFRAAREPLDLLSTELHFLAHYSASVSIELALRAVVASGGTRIGIIEPCFDSIPQLARRAGLSVTSLPEDTLLSGQLPTDLDAAFVVVPNNPTGWVPTIDALNAIAQVCASNQVQLIVDCSFRFFAPALDSWSIYETLEAADDLDYCVIEDTGKSWPLKDVKVGLTVAPATGALSRRLREVTDELLLNVSPFTVRLIRDVVALSDTEQQPSTIDRRRRAIAANRDALAGALLPLGFTPMTVTPIGVEWLRTPGHLDATELTTALASDGLSILPGPPFHWSSPEDGQGFIRVALAREPKYFQAAVYKLTALLDAMRHD